MLASHSGLFLFLAVGRGRGEGSRIFSLFGLAQRVRRGREYQGDKDLSCDWSIGDSLRFVHLWYTSSLFHIGY